MATDLEMAQWDHQFQQLKPVDLWRHPDFLVDENFVDGMGSAFGTTFKYEGGMAASAIVALKDKMSYPGGVPDPNFNPFEYMQGQGFYQNDMFKRLEESDAPEDREAYDMLLSARNPEDVEKTLRHWERKRAVMEASDEHGFAAFMGSVGSVGYDALITTMATIATGGMAAPAFANTATRLGMLAKRAKELVSVSRPSTAASRLPGAMRVGGAAGALGFAETAAMDMNRIVTTDEYIFNSLGGILLGGMLGGAFPHVLGRIHLDEEGLLNGARTGMTESELRGMRNGSEYGEMEGAGAAISPDGAHGGRTMFDMKTEEMIARDEQLVHQRVAKSPFTPMHNVIQKYTKRFGTGRAFTSPKAFITKMGNDVLLHSKSSPRLAGFMDAIYQPFSRIAKGNYKHEHELLGQRSVKNAADEAEFYNQMGDQWVQANDRIYNEKLVGKIGHRFGLFEKLGKNSELANRARKMFNKDQIPSRAETLALSQYLRRIRALEVENEQIIAKLQERAAKDPEFVYDEAEYLRRVPTFEETLQLFPRIKDLDVDDEIVVALRETADDMADAYDKRYAEMLDENVNAGMLLDEDKIPHYFPQLYNQKQMAQDSLGAQDWIFRAIQDEPDIDWINDNFSLIRMEKSTNPDGSVTEFAIREEGDVLNPGENVRDLIGKDPDLYKEVMDMWGDHIKDLRIKKIEESLDSLDAKIADSQLSSLEQANTRFNDQMDTISRGIQRHERRLDLGDEAYAKDRDSNPDWPQERENIATQILEGNAKLAEKEADWKEMLNIFDMKDRYAMLKQEQKRRLKGRPKSKKLLKEHYKKSEKLAKEAAATTTTALAREIRDSIMSGAQAHTSALKATDRLRTGNSRYMQRQINWRELAFTDEGKKFLNHDVENVDQIYLNTSMRQVAFRNTVGVWAEETLGKKFEPNDDILASINGYISDQGAKWMAGATPKEAAEIQRRIELTQKAFQQFMQVYNRSHIKDSSDSAVFEIMRGATAIAHLGTLAVSQISDATAATAALPGGFGAKWWGNFLNPTKSQVRTANKLIDQVKGLPEQERLVFFTQGATAQGFARYDAMVNPENIGQSLAGHLGEENSGVKGIMRLMTRDIGHVQNQFTLAPLMNKGVQSNAGMLQLKAMHKYIMDYDSFKQMDKENFARLGLGKRQVEQMRKLMSDPAMTQKLDDGTTDGLIVPRMDKWPEFLASQYERALVKAQREALIAPALGDMPTALNAYAPLSLFYQFASFPYTISNELVRKMVQNSRLHPRELNSYLPWITATATGAMVMYIKNRLTGKSDEEIWNRPMPEIVWDVMSRSPLTIGMSASIADSAFALIGPSVNDAFGGNVLPAGFTYFKKQQSFYGSFGPVLGLGNQMWTTAMAASNGNTDLAADRALRMLPFVNTVIPRTLMSLTNNQ